MVGAHGQSPGVSFDVREPVAGDATQSGRQPVRIGAEGMEPRESHAAVLQRSAELFLQASIRFGGCGQPGHVAEHDSVEIAVIGRIRYSGPDMGCGVYRQIRAVVECKPRHELTRAGRKCGHEHEVDVLPAARLVLHPASDGATHVACALVAAQDPEGRRDRCTDVGRIWWQGTMIEQNSAEPIPFIGECPVDAFSPTVPRG